MPLDDPPRKLGADDFVATLARFREMIASYEKSEPPPLFVPVQTRPGRPSMTPPLRPAATPTAAGITPGFEHLVPHDGSISSADLARLEGMTAEALAKVLGRVRRLERSRQKGRR